MRLSVIIVNWNSKAYLRKCLASIRRGSGLNPEIVVIDSGSNDGCGQMLHEEYPSVRFIQSPRNLGFAAANNRAFLEAAGEALLFLNPDTEVSENAIGAMVAHLQALPNAGVLGCRLLNSDGSLQTSCVQSIPTITNQILDSDFPRQWWPRSPLWGMAPLLEEGGHPREVAAVSGACLMIARSTFERVGGFSEDYFMYAEDVDLAYKVKRAGYRNYYVPTATVVHHGGNSTAQAGSRFSAVMRPEAIWRFLCKTRGRRYALGYRAAMAVAATARLAAMQFLPGLRAPVPDSGGVDSRHKWHGVLRWALRRDGIVRQYYPETPPATAAHPTHGMGSAKPPHLR